MPQEVISVAVFVALKNKDDEVLAVMRALIGLMAAKNYSRDTLYHDRKSRRYLDIRHWTSESSRIEAEEDPQVHSYWAKLGHLIRIEKIYESFVAIELEHCSNHEC